jgi:hypothetical protein
MKRKEDFVTKKYLDEALKDHSETIIEAVNFGFEENKKEHKRLEDKIDKSWKSQLINTLRRRKLSSRNL